MADKYAVGDIVEMKKQHPCGSKQWEVIRTGADFRIKCTGCAHQVMLARTKFEKAVKKIVKSDAGQEPRDSSSVSG
ncbi:hypothetical protein CLHUN_40010 [Ruminiclostridium hungatei]|uniref:DUF951 domain-containing protein n=1 Tax=Ruminiclostridium hungatei TaxID=48256 RepID=A0A1V4SF08_RUMHU|nr:DUF951 domain-containing protein [Ruminiclostridium hungatei]OPX42096.1 hypothetical protein CLHUN_40010 [Ruminiclostridium hungatei]